MDNIYQIIIRADKENISTLVSSGWSNKTTIQMLLVLVAMIFGEVLKVPEISIGHVRNHFVCFLSGM